MEVDADGMLYIVGLADGVELTGEETVAPTGYNKLTGEVTLSPTKMEEEIFNTSGTRYYDAAGNLVKEEVTGGSTKTVTKNLSDLDATAVKVVNNKGTELPSTGGIGTTIFYVIGAILVLGAGILLVTRRRMNAN
ncbi:MAG: LPXTG cell wall anchor domain-containing protein [Lachnospiraceae bacterium]|nr:LPXTG cell wall anchor domain-containing protein [Lachnospiraceae bacterium]